MFWEGLAAGALGLSALTSGLNFWQQGEQYDYYKNLQNRMFARDDTAVQRRVADLKAAGLNPVLAAGSGAESGPVVSAGKAPQLADMSNQAIQAMSMMQMDADISNKQKTAELIDQQVKNAKAEELRTKASTVGQVIDNAKNQYDFNIAQKSGMVTKPGAMGTSARDVASVLDAMFGRKESDVNTKDLSDINDVRVRKHLKPLDWNEFLERWKAHKNLYN